MSGNTPLWEEKLANLHLGFEVTEGKERELRAERRIPPTRPKKTVWEQKINNAANSSSELRKLTGNDEKKAPSSPSLNFFKRAFN